MSTPNRTRALTDLLAAHEYITQFRGAVCICGHIPDVNPETLQTQQDYHRAHLAEVILAAGYEKRPDLKVEITEHLNGPTTCRVERDGQVVFVGRDHVAEAAEVRKQARG